MGSAEIQACGNPPEKYSRRSSLEVHGNADSLGSRSRLRGTPSMLFLRIARNIRGYAAAMRRERVRYLI